VNMKVKKYVGDNMQDTIFKVKAELGSEAIILNTRKYKEGGILGFFGREKVEVLAGVEEKRSRAAPENRTSSGELDEIKNMLEDLNESWQRDDFVRNLDEHSKQLYDHLGEQNVREDLRKEIIQEIAAGQNRDEKLEILRDSLVDLMGESCPVTVDGRPHVVALIGPTGVGKTTTAAKLAARFADRSEMKVGFITADTYRIAAVQQLKTYSDIINIPLEVVYSREEFASVLAGDFRNYDLVFVDTPGSSWDDKLQLGRLQKLLTAELLDEVHLLISLNQKLSNMLAVIEEFSLLNPDRILLTKVDEATRYGDIVNLRSECQLPFSYYSCGQDVPDDLEKASPRHLLSLLLGDGDV